MKVLIPSFMLLLAACAAKPIYTKPVVNAGNYYYGNGAFILLNNEMYELNVGSGCIYTGYAGIYVRRGDSLFFTPNSRPGLSADEAREIVNKRLTADSLGMPYAGPIVTITTIYEQPAKGVIIGDTLRAFDMVFVKRR